MLNIAVLVGRIMKSPEARSLPSGVSLVNFDIRVPRAEEAADSVPVALFAKAGEQPPELDVGAEVLVVGRVRRRFFRSGGVTQSRTEVVADRVVPIARRRAAAQVLTEVTCEIARLGGQPAGPRAAAREERGPAGGGHFKESAGT